ncbi:unnamed protein product [Spirodela intermedia]|uniref:Uncharacterized protein n=2 Tax=Spirodela intermedia TaxID=51605 RepID=A0A7I8KD99_SPIIN|nr:unnamed protein product [Spirodela intermedia]CAA6658703.1 unnamed protein product [Spirodela intermedia]CAA7394985.1 unnamed protein product [Spirodela intermedia]
MRGRSYTDHENRGYYDLERSLPRCRQM